jgi:hypothetical protein
MTDRGIQTGQSTVEPPRRERKVVRPKNMALIALGAGAATAVLLGAALTLRGVARRPTGRERLERLVPVSRGGRTRAPMSRGRAPTRSSAGARRSGKQAPQPSWQGSTVRIAEALGTAVVTTLVGTLASEVVRRARERAVESVQHALSEP